MPSLDYSNLFANRLKTISFPKEAEKYTYVYFPQFNRQVKNTIDPIKSRPKKAITQSTSCHGNISTSNSELWENESLQNKPKKRKKKKKKKNNDQVIEKQNKDHDISTNIKKQTENNSLILEDSTLHLPERKIEKLFKRPSRSGLQNKKSSSTLSRMQNQATPIKTNVKTRPAEFPCHDLLGNLLQSNLSTVSLNHSQSNNNIKVNTNQRHINSSLICNPTKLRKDDTIRNNNFIPSTESSPSVKTTTKPNVQMSTAFTQNTACVAIGNRVEPLFVSKNKSDTLSEGIDDQACSTADITNENTNALSAKLFAEQARSNVIKNASSSMLVSENWCRTSQITSTIPLSTSTKMFMSNAGSTSDIITRNPVNSSNLFVAQACSNTGVNTTNTAISSEMYVTQANSNAIQVTSTSIDSKEFLTILPTSIQETISPIKVHQETISPIKVHKKSIGPIKVHKKSTATPFKNKNIIRPFSTSISNKITGDRSISTKNSRKINFETSDLKMLRVQSNVSMPMFTKKSLSSSIEVTDDVGDTNDVGDNSDVSTFGDGNIDNNGNTLGINKISPDIKNVKKFKEVGFKRPIRRSKLKDNVSVNETVADEFTQNNKISTVSTNMKNQIEIPIFTKRPSPELPIHLSSPSTKNSKFLTNIAENGSTCSFNKDSLFRSIKESPLRSETSEDDSLQIVVDLPNDFRNMPIRKKIPKHTIISDTESLDSDSKIENLTPACLTHVKNETVSNDGRENELGSEMRKKTAVNPSKEKLNLLENLTPAYLTQFKSETVSNDGRENQLGSEMKEKTVVNPSKEKLKLLENLTPAYLTQFKSETVSNDGRENELGSEMREKTVVNPSNEKLKLLESLEKVESLMEKKSILKKQQEIEQERKRKETEDLDLNNKIVQRRKASDTWVTYDEQWTDDDENDDANYNAGQYSTDQDQRPINRPQYNNLVQNKQPLLDDKSQDNRLSLDNHGQNYRPPFMNAGQESRPSFDSHGQNHPPLMNTGQISRSFYFIDNHDQNHPPFMNSGQDHRPSFDDHSQNYRPSFHNQNIYKYGPQHPTFNNQDFGNHQNNFNDQRPTFENKRGIGFSNPQYDSNYSNNRNMNSDGQKRKAMSHDYQDNDVTKRKKKRSKSTLESRAKFMENQRVNQIREQDKRAYNKTKPCVHFKMHGNCKMGDECQFSHDVMPDKKMALCKFYIRQECTKDNCLFLHGEWPCKFYYFHKNCKNGDACKYAHDDISDEIKEAFLAFVQVEEAQRNDVTQKENAIHTAHSVADVKKENELHNEMNTNDKIMEDINTIAISSESITDMKSDDTDVKSGEEPDSSPLPVTEFSFPSLYTDLS